jgi:DNA-binding MarR family transcriptional regulator
MTVRDENVIGALALADGLADDAGAGPLANALAYLAHCRGPAIDLLASALNFSPSLTVRLVDRPVRDGLAERDRDEAGGHRSWMVRLAEAGYASAQFVLTRSEALLGLWIAPLDLDERTASAAIAEKLLGRPIPDRHVSYRICRMCDFASWPSCPVREAVR